jgi:hypothetical protein
VLAGVAFPRERPGDCFRAGMIAACAVDGLLAVVTAAGWSGSGGESTDRVENGVEVVLPGPACGHPQRPLAAGAGDLEEVAAAGSGGLHGPVREADLGSPSAEVVREGGITVQALLACIWPDGKCARAWSLRSRITSSMVAWSR